MNSKEIGVSFETQGFFVFKNVLEHEQIKNLQQQINACIKNESPESLKHLRSLGSLTKLGNFDWLIQLWSDRSALNILESLGAKSIRYSDSYLFHKFPENLATFWHQDWWCWNESQSYADAAPQIGLLYFLQDTTDKNAALRVIPGSHKKYSNLHKIFLQSNKASLRAAEDPESEIYQDHKDQITVEVQAGDVIAIDARLLHGSHSNRTSSASDLITSWYYPNYDQLSPAIRSAIGSCNLEVKDSQDLSLDAKQLLSRCFDSVSAAEITENPTRELMRG